MIELTTIYGSLPSSQREEAARELHQRIQLDAEQAANALYDMGHCLKAMKEAGLYAELGYSSFEEYTEKEFGFKQRQAYSYIRAYEKLGRQFLQSNAKLGITKLALLADVGALSREEFLEENDVSGMSVKELEELVREKKDLGEQVSLLQEQVRDREDQFEAKSGREKELEELRTKLAAAEDEKAHIRHVSEDTQKWYELACGERDEARQRAEALEAERQTADEDTRRLREAEEALEQARAELAGLREKPVDVAVVEPSAEDLSRIREEARAAFEKEKLEAEETARLEAKRERERAVAEAREAAAKETEERLKASLDGLQAEKLAADERAARLAKELEVSADGEFLTANFHFESSVEALEKLLAALKAMRESSPEKARKLAAGVRRFLGTLEQRLAELEEGDRA